MQLKHEANNSSVPCQMHTGAIVYYSEIMTIHFKFLNLRNAL